MCLKFCLSVQVPPDALRPKPDPDMADEEKPCDNSPNVETKKSDKNFTYRTEIVGNVVVKKKIKSDGQAMKVRIQKS